jgi:lysozyme family protein
MDMEETKIIKKENLVLAGKCMFKVALLKEANEYVVSVQQSSIRSETGWLLPKVRWRGRGIQNARMRYKKIIDKTQERAIWISLGLKK